MLQNTGYFVWHELNTTDLNAAIAFYSHVVTGWSFEGSTEGEHAYPHIHNASVQVGGATWLPEDAKKMGAPPHWNGYITVEDVDAAAAKVQALGGRLYFGPMDIPKTGRFAVVADPQGAAFSIFTPESAGPLADTKQHGAFNWHELMTSDPAAALAFYGELFGWKTFVEMDMGPMGAYTVIGLGDLQFGGILKRPPQMPASAWLHYIMVADLDAALARATSSGGVKLNGPMPVPGGARIVQLQDPQGAMFALVGM